MKIWLLIFGFSTDYLVKDYYGLFISLHFNQTDPVTALVKTVRAILLQCSHNPLFSLLQVRKQHEGYPDIVNSTMIFFVKFIGNLIV